MKKFKKMTLWIRGHKFEFALLVIILTVACYMRFYRLPDYMTFLGDEGRDVILVRRLLVNFDPILIGPGTSIGNMYLGPLYYYFIAPSLLLFNFSPIGPSMQIAFFGVITVLLIYIIGRDFFTSRKEGISTAGLIAAFLYAIAPTVIIYSRSSWNPNIMPFAVLLTVYALWKIYNNRSFGWFIVLSVGFALVLNSHYLGLLLAPFIGIYLFITYISTSGKSRVSFIKHSLVGLLIGAFLMSPLLIFDMRHGWINTKAVTKFFSERQTTVSARPWNALPKMIPLGEKAITRLVAGRNILAGRWTFIAMLGSLIWIAGINRERLENKEKKVYLFLLSWLFIAFVGLGLYKQEIYDHYYGFFFPAPFLLLGGICEHLINKHKIRGSWIVLTGITLLAFYNFLESPLKYHPNMQLTRTRVVSQKILEESKGEPFNLGVIAERNYEDAYQYYLEKWNSKVVDIDPLRADETITDQLFVVCEMPPEKCDPTHNAKAEVANFGWSKIDNKWEVYGVQIFKLVHTQ